MIFVERRIQDAYRNGCGIALTPLEVRDVALKLGVIKPQPQPKDMATAPDPVAKWLLANMGCETK